MLYTHIVKYRSGEEVRHNFHNKTESNKALQNAMNLHKAFGAIESVTVHPTNYPGRGTVYRF